VEREALKKAFDYSIFTDGLFILNKRGNVIYNYPPQLLSQVNFLTLPKANLALTEGRPFISDIHTIEPSRKKVVYIIVPLRNSNGIVEGAVGGEIDPSAQSFNEIIRSSRRKIITWRSSTAMAFVIASSDAKRVFMTSRRDTEFSES
jgi:hypothetical protein